MPPSQGHSYIIEPTGLILIVRPRNPCLCAYCIHICYADSVRMYSAWFNPSIFKGRGTCVRRLDKHRCRLQLIFSFLTIEQHSYIKPSEPSPCATVTRLKAELPRYSCKMISISTQPSTTRAPVTMAIEKPSLVKQVNLQRVPDPLIWPLLCEISGANLAQAVKSSCCTSVPISEWFYSLPHHHGTCTTLPVDDEYVFNFNKIISDVRSMAFCWKKDILVVTVVLVIELNIPRISGVSN